ncbi:hypothetical protein HY993_04780 [Candidatus Micrarchaeota archaeon]|nr:hypothetical protein [Candidatus Micrarchaeota archaeon]
MKGLVDRVILGVISFAILLALVGSISAFSLGVDSDAVSFTSTTTAVIHATVADAKYGDTVRLSADLNSLSGYFDESTLFISSNGAKSTNLRVQAKNQCVIGSDYVTVYAQICDGTDCQVASRQVNVEVRPSASSSCSTYTKLNKQTLPETGFSCGETGCNAVASSISYTSYFDPTVYVLSIRKASERTCSSTGACYYQQLNPSGQVQLDYKIINSGPQGDFRLRAVTNEDSLKAVLSQTKLSLQKFDEKQFYATLYADNAAAGMHKVTIQVLKDNAVVEEYEEFIEVRGAYKAQLAISNIGASGLTASACSQNGFAALNGELTNTGIAIDSYSVTASVSGSIVSPSVTFRLKPGQAQAFNILVPISKLSIGENSVLLSAKSINVEGKGVAKVIVSPCATKTIDSKQEVKNEKTLVSAVVKNDFNTTLKNVEGRITGIPANWTVASNSFDLGVGESKNLSVEITAATSEPADKPILEILAGGQVIASTQLPAINSGNPLTGLFTAIGGINLVYAILVIAALAILGLYSKKFRQQDETEAYKQKIRSLTLAKSSLNE